MYNYRCENCGASLDPGEQCDCGASEKSQPRLITMEDWDREGNFFQIAKPGDRVEEEIVGSFRDCVPPALLDADFLQVGEPVRYEKDSRTGTNKPTFVTFSKDDTGTWKYCGVCFLGRSTEPRR